MEKNNVYSSAKIVNSNDEIQSYQLGTFVQNGKDDKQTNITPNTGIVNTQALVSSEATLKEVQNLSVQIQQLNQKVTLLQQNGLTQKDIDDQVVQAIKDLKQYANFFEQATFQMETKLLKTSIAIAQKIIAIEVGENSANIAKQTITHLFEKIKNASKIRIHLNPKDYEILKNQLNLENHIELVDDSNVTAGGVVIASDLGNFDGNIESKVSTMLESLDVIV